MRLSGLKGRTADEIAADKNSSLPGWALRREYRSTYRAAMDDAEKLVAGTFVGRVPADQARVPVSIEESPSSSPAISVLATSSWRSGFMRISSSSMLASASSWIARMSRGLLGVSTAAILRQNAGRVDVSMVRAIRCTS